MSLLPVNLLELRPVRKVAWEPLDEERVVLLVPKFKSRLAVKYIMPMFAKPNFRIKLDRFGSFLWRQLDGATSVQQMGDRMKAHFGESVEPVFDRVGKFIQTLEKEQFIALQEPEPTALSGA